MSRYTVRPRNWEYMDWVRSQRCLLAKKGGAGDCQGRTEADHAGVDHARGRKAPDETCIPLCTRHHRDRHEATGFFRDMSKDERRQWRLEAIVRTQQAYFAHQRGLELL